jgi:hypothetical protein
MRASDPGYRWVSLGVLMGEWNSRNSGNCRRYTMKVHYIDDVRLLLSEISPMAHPCATRAVSPLFDFGLGLRSWGSVFQHLQDNVDDRPQAGGKEASWSWVVP